MIRLLALSLVAGCAHGSGPAPTAAVHAFVAAGSHDDPRAAYRLLSASVRRSISEEDFATRWRANGEERRSQLAALGPLTARPTSERARCLWSDSREVELVREPLGWRLTSPRISTGGAASPEEAVRHFAEALERHDMDGFLDLLADPLRSLVERELSDRLGRLKTAVHKEIQVEGARARIRLDDRYYLELKQENGRWRVSDFN